MIKGVFVRQVTLVFQEIFFEIFWEFSFWKGLVRMYLIFQLLRKQEVIFSSSSIFEYEEQFSFNFVSSVKE